MFYGEELLVPHPSPKLEDLLMSAALDCLLSILAAKHILKNRIDYHEETHISCN
jgi:hypothetical protein